MKMKLCICWAVLQCTAFMLGADDRQKLLVEQPQLGQPFNQQNMQKIVISLAEQINQTKLALADLESVLQEYSRKGHLHARCAYMWSFLLNDKSIRLCDLVKQLQSTISGIDGFRLRISQQTQQKKPEEHAELEGAIVQAMIMKFYQTLKEGRFFWPLA